MIDQCEGCLWKELRQHDDEHCYIFKVQPLGFCSKENPTEKPWKMGWKSTPEIVKGITAKMT